MIKSGKAEVQGVGVHAAEDQKKIRTCSWWINHPVSFPMTSYSRYNSKVTRSKICHFTKKHTNSAILYRPVKDFSHSFIVLTPFILLSWFQNKACVTLDRFFSLALMYVAVWSNHAVINFIGNYFETHFCQVFIFKKFSKIGYLVFCYRMRASFNLMYPETV